MVFTNKLINVESHQGHSKLIIPKNNNKMIFQKPFRFFKFIKYCGVSVA